MSTVAGTLHISAYDAGKERTLDLTLKGENYQRVLSEAAWDHANIAQRLKLGVVFGARGEQVRLEMGPPQENIVPMAKPKPVAKKPRPANAVFPAASGAKPPQKGQLRVAAAVLDSQRKQTPLSVQTLTVDLSTRPVIQDFLKAGALQRVE